MKQVYIFKDHNGKVIEREVKKVCQYSENGIDFYEVYLKDPFDICNASVGEIIERLNEYSDELVSHQYNGGILYLADYHNVDKLIHDLNIPYYESPWHTNLIQGHYLKNSYGIFLNLHSLRYTIRKEREKGNVKE